MPAVNPSTSPSLSMPRRVMVCPLRSEALLHGPVQNLSAMSTGQSTRRSPAKITFRPKSLHGYSRLALDARKRSQAAGLLMRLTAAPPCGFWSEQGAAGTLYAVSACVDPPPPGFVKWLLTSARGISDPRACSLQSSHSALQVGLSCLYTTRCAVAPQPLQPCLPAGCFASRWIHPAELPEQSSRAKPCASLSQLHACRGQHGDIVEQPNTSRGH